MKKFNVLVIDDNVGNMASLEEMLIANDFVVRTAFSVKAGIQLLAKESFDLIFIEAKMPVMDSYLTCQTIKSDARFRSTPVIFILGNDDLIFVKEIY